MAAVARVGTPLAGPAVRIRGLRRVFDGKVVLDHVDLDIARGEFVALLGRSGSGKSTILRAVAGLDAESEGDRIQASVRRSVLFQDSRLLPWAQVIDNVVLGAWGPGARQRAETALREVGLAGHETKWPRTLSGGEQQRVALARSLMRDPELLLADEPFSALDALTRIRMQQLLRQLCARHRPAVLFVTHDVDEALTLADRAVIVADGRIVFDREVAGVQREAALLQPMRAEIFERLGVHKI